MRAFMVFGWVVGMILATHVGMLRGDPVQETENERIVYLIEQLGDDGFTTREAASDQLVVIGKPALPLLRKAAATSHCLEIRWRAEHITNKVVTRTLPIGTWNVEFANGVTEVCRIGNGGVASVDEPRRRSGGRAVVQRGSTVITFQDDRVERWTWDGRRFVVEHWFPSSQFPTATPVVGFAQRTP